MCFPHLHWANPLEAVKDTRTRKRTAIRKHLYQGFTSSNATLNELRVSIVLKMDIPMSNRVTWELGC